MMEGDNMEQEYFSASDLAKRWDVTPQTVNNWARRHDNFPRPAFRVGDGYIPVYKLQDVERYEKERKLTLTGGTE